jgi:hypothetical protein
MRAQCPHRFVCALQPGRAPGGGEAAQLLAPSCPAGCLKAVWVGVVCGLLFALSLVCGLRYWWGA